MFYTLFALPITNLQMPFLSTIYPFPDPLLVTQLLYNPVHILLLEAGIGHGQCR